MQDTTQDTSRIAELNDRFRRTFLGGRVMTTCGVNELPANTRAKLFAAVRNYSEFEPDNDPYGEHDFGKVDVDGGSFFWKIDYYDPTLSQHSENPADPSVTTRVLTIMLVEEY